MDTAPCRSCQGSGWVCESHLSWPWGGLCCDGPRRAALVGKLHEILPYRGPLKLAWRIRVLCAHGACHCGGAGQACGCNPGGHVDWLTVIAESGP